MDITRDDSAFPEAILHLLEGHRSKVFSIVTVDGKQERGYAPVVVGRDYLRCRSGLEERQLDRIYPLTSIVSITPSG
ncbi:MAG: hypothetical protein IT538_16075 [Variibacter sp.]|nr:hypothetical protein [Variibacter sp.]